MEIGKFNAQAQEILKKPDKSNDKIKNETTPPPIPDKTNLENTDIGINPEEINKLNIPSPFEKEEEVNFPIPRSSAIRQSNGDDAGTLKGITLTPLTKLTSIKAEREKTLQGLDDAVNKVETEIKENRSKTSTSINKDMQQLLLQAE